MATTRADPIAIRAEPMDERRCRFQIDRPLYPGRWIYFSSAYESRGAPLAEALFALGGLSGVLIAHDVLTVTRTASPGLPVVGPMLRVVSALIGRSGDGSWTGVGTRIGAVIRDWLETGEPAVGETPAVLVSTEHELRRRVQRVLDEQVNPVIAGHGGGVEILDVKDNVLYLQMRGGCQGCGLKDLTLQNGVSAAVRDDVPEIGAIFDLTDHAAGKTPWQRPRGR